MPQGSVCESKIFTRFFTDFQVLYFQVLIRDASRYCVEWTIFHMCIFLCNGPIIFIVCLVLLYAFGLQRTICFVRLLVEIDLELDIGHQTSFTLVLPLNIIVIISSPVSRKVGISLLLLIFE